MTRYIVALLSLFAAVAIEARHLEKRQIEPICTSRGGKPAPDPNDCSGYFDCSSDYPIPRKCGPRTEFNEAIARCDWPTSNNPSNCRRILNVNTKPELTNICGPNPSGNESQAYLVPHPTLCNSYFACSPYLLHSSCFFCGEGLYFPLGGSRCVANPGQAPDKFCENRRRYVAHREVTAVTVSNECSIYIKV